jgi:hypothetical protein
MDGYDIIFGTVERDLFSCVSSVGHRTFLALDGHHYTGVESFDSVQACEGCLHAVVTEATADASTESVDRAQVAGSPYACYGTDTLADVAESYVLGTDEPFGEVNVNVLSEDVRWDYIVTCTRCGRYLAGPLPTDYFEACLSAYQEALVWQGHDWDDQIDGNPKPLDENYCTDDFAPEAIEEMTVELTDFLQANWQDVAQLDPEQVGHDFVLTRNGHGAGFWDRGLGDVGDRLTEACKPYGTADPYVGDDGQLYVQ